ncbi:Eco57I restriction-modification methylase domain-containing protein [Mycoplasma nasistruthionis]|uniref:site-specific DNA-methyltransferase (adenine-specific) n=1 Tax=Mycoplasma nasistruthionis TaxID=353852 RepID=A0A4Y6I580_9MOLU|nr:N-6 DNA methylase [Mycoplasma nasistruthionis]QDF64756.1 hypothetical protein FIV53_00245 [Mycoplasma nasistruthionis]
MNKEFLGQVFTPSFIVDKMINLISLKNPCLILEPSSGGGAFYNVLIQKYKNVVGVEVDRTIAHEKAVIKSYFNTNYKPDVIIGNPPYVAFKNIIEKLESNFLNHKPNLFYFFLEKALNDLREDGELIFITPASIFMNTSPKKLNKWIYDHFSITHFEQIPEDVWENASIPTAIVKIVKTKNHKDKINYYFSNGKIFFGKKIFFNEKIIVKVGGASGFNSKLEKGKTAFVVSSTERDGQLKLIKYEPRTWIRPVPSPPEEFTYQIFVNCKTRNEKPFYMLKIQTKNTFINYDASVLCLFVNCTKTEALSLVKKLNSINWEQKGIKQDGRFHFSQSVLQAIL